MPGTRPVLLATVIVLPASVVASPLSATGVEKP